MEQLVALIRKYCSWEGVRQASCYFNRVGTVFSGKGLRFQPIKSERTLFCSWGGGGGGKALTMTLTPWNLPWMVNGQKN